MKRALVEIFMPTNCPLDWNLVWIILEMAELAQVTERSAYFYLYNCPLCPICAILQQEEKKLEE